MRRLKSLAPGSPSLPGLDVRAQWKHHSRLLRRSWALLFIEPTVVRQRNGGVTGSVTGSGSGSANRPESALEERESRPLLRFAGGGLQYAPQLRSRKEAFIQNLVLDLSGEPLHDMGRPGKGAVSLFGFPALLAQLPASGPYLPQLTGQADLLRQGPGLLQARRRRAGRP